MAATGRPISTLNSRSIYTKEPSNDYYLSF